MFISRNTVQEYCTRYDRITTVQLSERNALMYLDSSFLIECEYKRTCSNACTKN